jgi:hypothetical protein
MANESELLLNVVIENKRKMLRCLTKGTWVVQEFPVLLTQTTLPPAERQSLTHAWSICETWKTG